VVPAHAYNGTTALLDQLAATGAVVVRRVDPTDQQQVREALQGAAMLWIESPTNPMLEVSDVRALAASAREAGALTVCDNTFATPLVQRPLTDGVDLVLHPHVGTLVETAEQVDRALAHTDVPWCFDSGHLLIGGVDPAAFVREHAARIGHVHLKDVDARLAEDVRDGARSLVNATQAGLFRPLGDGDAGIDAVLRLLEQSGYERWLVLEQDIAITGSEPPAGGGPALDVRKSIEFLSTRAPRRERVSQR